MLDAEYADVPADTIQQGLKVGIDALWAAVEDTKRQLFIATATWALEEWEQRLGIASNTALTDEQRRETITARQRGGVTFNTEAIQRISDAYNGGSVAVVTDYANYLITITFTGMYGVPEQFDAFKAEIERQIPAHMTGEYGFKWATHNQLTMFSHDELKAYTHNAIRVGEPLGG